MIGHSQVFENCSIFDVPWSQVHQLTMWLEDEFCLSNLFKSALKLSFEYFWNSLSSAGSSPGSRFSIYDLRDSDDFESNFRVLKTGFDSLDCEDWTIIGFGGSVGFDAIAGFFVCILFVFEFCGVLCWGGGNSEMISWWSSMSGNGAYCQVIAPSIREWKPSVRLWSLVSGNED